MRRLCLSNVQLREGTREGTCTNHRLSLGFPFSRVYMNIFVRTCSFRDDDSFSAMQTKSGRSLLFLHRTQDLRGDQS